MVTLISPGKRGAASDIKAPASICTVVQLHHDVFCVTAQRDVADTQPSTKHVILQYNKPDGSRGEL